jgi:uncharacterized protein (TIGR02118 family)
MMNHESGWVAVQVTVVRKEAEQMIKVSVFYPNEEGKKFDMEYYLNKHLPMVQQKLGTALKGGAVEQGLGGAEPGSRATYIAMGHLYFDSVEAFQTAFGPHAESIMGDIPNYTDIQPTIQVSEVKM